MSNIIEFKNSEELKAVEGSKAKKIKALFEPMVQMLEGFESDYNTIIKESENGINEDLMSRAKRLRIDISKIRINAEKARKAEKEEYLRAGKAIDGANNILKWAVQDRENNLKEIELYFERLEEEKKRKLQEERVSQLSKYVEDAELRDLSSMDDDVWEAYLGNKKQQYNDRIEAERKAEEARLEAERIEKLTQERFNLLTPFYDFVSVERSELGEMSEKDFKSILSGAKKAKEKHEAEQEKIRKENERLKKEREKEKARIEKERKEKEAQIKKERQRVAELERQERQRKEAELKAKKEAERKAKEAALAPEKERLEKWIQSFELPELPGDENETSKEIRAKFEAFKSWASNEVKNLKMEAA
jgi:hypothetical protein